MEKINIALDGPSGVGKSSAADLLAERFGLVHLDTGAMYRAIGYALDRENILPQESPQLEKALENLHLTMEGDKVFLNGEDVSEVIRTPEVSMLASKYSAVPSIRRKLVSLQQQIAADKGYILDGRDICDVVLPDAEVKIFLNASARARAQRRYLQDLQKGKQVEFEQVFKEIEERDLQDRTRSVSPLKISEQAVVVDSSDMNLEETVDAMSDIVSKALKRGTL